MFKEGGYAKVTQQHTHTFTHTQTLASVKVCERLELNYTAEILTRLSL